MKGLITDLSKLESKLDLSRLLNMNKVHVKLSGTS